MIISASRRTDIPALYPRWFINRIRAGFCEVPNPFNAAQVTRVSLLPQDVDVIVFWTRNPKPLFPYLDELDRRGYRYYFNFTLIGYPRPLEGKSPSLKAGIAIFRELAQRVGPQRVVWRYDPIVFSNHTGAAFHRENYARIAAALRGYTRRSVISLMTPYAKVKRRFAALEEVGVRITPFDGEHTPRFAALMRSLAESAAANNMTIQSCASEYDLTPYGILPGKCVDDALIQEIFGIEVGHGKDPSQRAACGCVVSKDIGMYDTCIFGCAYCYANSDFARSRRRYKAHDPKAARLVAGQTEDRRPQTTDHRLEPARYDRE